MIKRCTEVAHPSSGYGSSFFEWIRIFFVAVVIAGVLNGLIFQVILIEQHSMEPTLTDGMKIYLSKSAYWFSEPKSGDIVVFFDEKSQNNYVKRIIGLPGDEILIENGKVYRNGTELFEPYINEITLGTFKITVPEGQYFCMGDNRNVSMDSRDERIGCVSRSQIIGKVLFSISPWKKIERYVHE